MMSITRTETLLCDPRTDGETPLYHLAAHMGLLRTAGKFITNPNVCLAISLA